MKTYNVPSTSKLVAQFDQLLKDALLEDIKAFRSRNKFISSNKQAQAQQNLSAA